MWVLVLLAGFMSVLVSKSAINDYFAREEPVQSRETAAVVAKYRTFAWVAQAYMAQNPSATGSISWATIKTATAVPDAMKSINVSPNWKIVAGSGSYVLCTDLPERAIAAVTNLFPAPRQPFSTTGGKVVFAESQSEADTEGAKCT